MSVHGSCIKSTRSIERRGRSTYVFTSPIRQLASSRDVPANLPPSRVAWGCLYLCLCAFYLLFFCAPSCVCSPVCCLAVSSDLVPFRIAPVPSPIAPVCIRYPYTYTAPLSPSIAIASLSHSLFRDSPGLDLLSHSLAQCTLERLWNVDDLLRFPLLLRVVSMGPGDCEG